MTGLKINFHKSDSNFLGEVVDTKHEFDEILTCKSGSLPMKYPGCPMTRRELEILIGKWLKTKWKANFDVGNENG
jgi:hypothetical protein